MLQNLLRHKLILILVAFIIAGAAWYGLSSSSAPVPDLVTSAPLGQPANKADQELVATLLALRAVKLDGGIFGDPAFLSLKDFSTEIVQEAVGRTNPFAPLPLRAVQSATGTRESMQSFKPRR